ncbi:phosphate uptake regulator PhoU [Corynebacterium propinquum]|uniref:phosphate signaling complex PhoU family protein n=1 Tax=Corynebacterium propinquum TaxID=43769 RepID=UPI0011A38BBD|nr:phosphate uptake regulator PhoU [Corynebacterium propinquum]WKS31582.1 phosphate uptake regulator PhoU [Corynebacterium propinquum]WKS35958.1 phosphate uptake regulator PhoU [Corynebacterium propinquum]WKS37920.1 phosphate uptake regulator PhoU [Corynebacterium propinquum]WKS42320.1 phosphate uptake regulator PhoU [Corynebacterium propinquum]WKS46495.1 phosphate uptake regulator PhoU [Corynebacterium propinquum]
MRTAYRDTLNNFANDIVELSDTVHQVMDLASQALLAQPETAQEPAAQAVARTEDLNLIRERSEARAFELLALEGPVASELRQVVSSIYIVEDFTRMAALATHIATAVLRRSPERVVPESVTPDFARLAELVDDMAQQTNAILKDPAGGIDTAINDDDDAVDKLNATLLALTTADDWAHGSHAAVDVAMLARYYERYADHCVNVCARIVFLATGKLPEGFLSSQFNID